MTIAVVHCRTADEVRAQAARSRAFREQMWKRLVKTPLRVIAPPPLPAPAPLPESAPAPPAPMAQQAIAAVADPPEPLRLSVSVRAIIEATALHFNLTYSALVSALRNARVVRARQIAMFVSHEHFYHSYPRVGRAMGGRDHSTAIQAVGKIKAALKWGDVDTAAAVEEIAEKVRLQAVWLPPFDETRYRGPNKECTGCRRWSEDDDARLKDIRRTYPEMRPKEVASLFGRTHHAILKRAMKHGVPFGRLS